MNLHIRPMTEQDFPFAEQLRAVAGWNQTESDWKRYLLCQPDGCFLAEWAGLPAATLTTTCFPPDLAWIGMVLVHPEFRRRGIARALMVRALEFLDQKGIGCVKLDATPMGKPLYEQLGFRDEWKLRRWKADVWGLPAMESAAVELRAPGEEDWPALLHLDGTAFGSRRELLLKILAQQSDRVRVSYGVDGRALGYGMIRKGMVAAYLGPLVTSHPESLPVLVSSLAADCRGRPLFWDIPDAQAEAAALAAAGGMKPVRDLVRMFRPVNPAPGVPGMICGIADPATG